MRAGRLRHRIEIQEQKEFQNLIGSKDEVWTTIAELWASVEPITSKDIFSSSTASAEIGGKIVIRYNDIVKKHHRILFRGRILDIVGDLINVGERDREMHILFKERHQ